MIQSGKHKTTYNQLSDEELIRIYIECDEKVCIEVLFTRYTHLVYGICIKYLRDENEAEDATMEIFESLFVKLKNHEISSFKNWLYSVSCNKCLMILRKKKNHFENRNKVFENLYAHRVEKNNLNHLIGNDEIILKNKIEEALCQLKHEQEHCIRLMYIEEKTYKEISFITGYNLKSVKSYIQNGKRNLKMILSDNERD